MGNNNDETESMQLQHTQRKERKKKTPKQLIQRCGRRGRGRGEDLTDNH